ncbi:MAG: homoserine O-succinyltransferase [Pseudomonadota bacterium]
MALVQHNNLSSIDRVAAEGIEVCSPEKVDPESFVLHVGFLNMMPDAAIAATERQFLRLIGSNDKTSVYCHPFTIQGVERSSQAKVYIQHYYSDLAKIKEEHLDAIVITGANVMQPILTKEKFWDDLQEVLIWSKENIKSTMCSCLATHAAVKVFYDIDRKHMGNKCWGVFEHEVINKDHLLLADVQSSIKMCHSRFNDISYADFLNHKVDALITSRVAGVQLAAEKDLSMIYFQGHPEYDDISLLKEYKREIYRYLSGDRNDYPPLPENYLDKNAIKVAEKFKQLLSNQSREIELLDQFPESLLQKSISNPWKQSAHTIFSNWLDSIVV